jgi:ornithine cyclodeaminase/alanine dehydrogenase-like protein (mu-crystallin family)
VASAGGRRAGCPRARERSDDRGAHPEAGGLSERTLHAEPVEIVVGRKPGRERDDAAILCRHRGLGTAMLETAARSGVGRRLRFR